MRYHNITKDDLLNGDGIRVVLWVAGCEHHCPNCQNPITWDPDDGLEFTNETVLEIFEELKKDYNSGITFSGGDPLYSGNREKVLTVASSVKSWFPNKTIWLYTGYCWEDICDLPGIENIDVIVDGPYIDQLRDTVLKWRGSSNQRVIDVKRSLETKTIVLHCD